MATRGNGHGRGAAGRAARPVRYEAAARVLVVGPGSHGRRSAVAWLAEAGFVVEETERGAQALARAGEGGLDLVLVADDPPDATGVDLCRRLKAAPRSAAVPVVHLASPTGPSGRSAALRSGADGYLDGPVTRDDLLASVEAALRCSSARRRAERLADRFVRLNMATLELSQATGFLELVEAGARTSAALLGARTVVLASGDNQVALARAGPTGPIGLERLDRVPLVLGPDGPARPDEPFTVPARLSPEAIVGLEPGRPYRVVTVESAPSGSSALVAVELAGDRSEEAEPAEETGETDLLLRQLARALGVALANLHALRVERGLALQLQHCLLPARLPELDRLELAARYVASAASAGVGGDFFEVVELGRDRVGIAIGDVQGHSLDAAAVMAGLRHWLRAYAVEGHRPAAVLDQVNRLLLVAHPSLIATACYGELDLASGRLCVANAGHVPPILAEAGAARFLPARGRLLGVEGAPAREVEVTLGPGAVLVFVTDGLVERRREPLEVGLERLRSGVADALGEGLDALCDRLLGAIGNEVGDDVALVACRWRRSPGSR